MTPIGSIFERNILLNGADVLTAKGYTQVPTRVLDGVLARIAEDLGFVVDAGHFAIYGECAACRE